jgi:hypothetical protein
MNKGELIDKIAKDAKVSKVQASNALNSTIDGIGRIRHLLGQLAESSDWAKPPNWRPVEDTG